MKGMLYLSDYQSDDGKRSAKVYRRLELNDYVTECYEGGMISQGHPFPTEQEAEDYAEDWVLRTTTH